MAQTALYTLLWVAWIVAGVALEGSALLRRRPGLTLSVNLWHWFAVKDARPTARTWALRGVWLLFLTWLLLHLGFGWLSL